MQNGRLLAIGDIHGCLDLLQRLIEQVAPTPEDQMVFLGDYIDRGPHSPEVIDFLLILSEKLPNIIFLKGNHEAMLLDYLDGRNQTLYLGNGGTATLAQYRHHGGMYLPREHLDFLHNLRLYHETEQFIFVHAGLRPGLPPARQQAQDLLWIREEFLEADYDWGKTVVFGHTPVRTPYFADKRIGLDTGAGHGRSLTCCEVRQGRCWTSA
jgi:serine/threonine protein phosphatase 1